MDDPLGPAACMNPRCAELARRAEVEYRAYHPEDPRGQTIYCERCRSALDLDPHAFAQRPAVPAPIVNPCAICQAQAEGYCAFCRLAVCERHSFRSMHLLTVKLCRTCSADYQPKAPWSVPAHFKR